MKTSKLVCTAAVFLQTLSLEFHALIVNRNEKANYERMPITTDRLGEIKRDQTWSSCLTCVVTELVYANTIVRFNLGE